MAIDYSRVMSPAFVLDEGRLRRNLELMQRVQQDSGCTIILALKGFSFWKTFPLVAKYLGGATASSLFEARLIFEEMGCKAHTYAPAYRHDEMEELLGYSSHITFNSLAQFHAFEDKLHALEHPVSVGLRVNPQYSEVSTALYNPAAPGSRLGILAADLGGSLPERVEGLHVHTLCESPASATHALIASFEEQFGHFLPHLKWVNFGGGHLMTRKGYDVALLIQSLKEFQERHPHLEVILEPGSAVAWETGELVSTVLDVVENNGIKTAILDVSFTAHMPDTLEMPYRPRIVGATDPREGEMGVRLGGVSCLAGDFMEAYQFEQALQIGDRVILLDMMHYTMVKTTMFNGVRHPDICICREDGTLEVLRHFAYEDFKGRLS